MSASLPTTLEALTTPAPWAGGLYLEPAAVLEVLADAEPPASRLDASGYGTTGTRYRVRLADGRTRRVYAHALGNGATLTVRVLGRDAHLGGAVEYRAEVLAATGADPGAERAAAVLEGRA